ncbi:hypothetical protein MRB53_010276 [Persea americana]|uniref:Uncharacterized protein n=1 Tax=Persea americana TaxID=3435 RepID=A0ACC2LRD7_PERAE|nr:hypothetical protein MRB53_010276 [Persea americana]
MHATPISSDAVPSVASPLLFVDLSLRRLIFLGVMRGKVSPRHLFPSSFALPLGEMPNEKETATENKGVMRGKVSPRHLFPSSFALPLGEMPNEKETATENKGVMRGKVSPRHLFPSSFALPLGEMPNEKETATENKGVMRGKVSPRHLFPSSFALPLGEMPNEKETATENKGRFQFVTASILVGSTDNHSPEIMRPKKFDSWVAHLCPGFTTSNVVAALRSQSDPDLALDLFRWISQQRGYCPDPLAYLAIIDIIASGKRFSSAESLRASLATLLIKLSENNTMNFRRGLCLQKSGEGYGVCILNKDKDADLSVKIKEGFGPNGLGIISVSDVICSAISLLACVPPSSFSI